MTFFAVVHGECDAQMADAAKLTFQIERHRKVFGRLLFDIENVGVAVVAIQPANMSTVRENRRRDIVPFRLQSKRFPVAYFWWHNRQIIDGLEEMPPHRPHPVNAVAQHLLRVFVQQLREVFFSVAPVAVVALPAVALIVPESRLPVMTPRRTFRTYSPPP
jgi:hypothetical protein